MTTNTTIANERVELVKPGCLGTCWYGKYHYVEPWVGCEHDCAYCYAKFRTPVTETLNELGSDFANPVTLGNAADMLSNLAKAANSGALNAVKLSRFTDIFSPKFVRNGLSYEVLKVLAESKVNRIIITTKGTPDDKSFALIETHKDKFSYSTVAKPETSEALEGPAVAPLSARLEAAARINRMGALTTIHMDPMIPGVEDDEHLLRAHFQKLKSLGLNRVMFSYLLLNPPMIDSMLKTYGNVKIDPILANYDSLPRQVLPKDEETIFIGCQASLKQESVKRISGLLTDMGFDYVLCSLKSGREASSEDNRNCRLCDGGFYA